MTRDRKLLSLGTAFAFLAVAALLPPPAAHASSNFETGLLRERNPYRPIRGYCRLFLGPRDFLADGEFELLLGDLDLNDGDELQLNGRVIRHEDGSVTLETDKEAAREFYADVLEATKDDFDLHQLDVEVFKDDFDLGPQDITCEMRLLGKLRGRAPVRSILGRPRVGTVGGTHEVRLTYEGAGLFYDGVTSSIDDVATEARDATAQTQAATASDVPPAQASATCPTPNFTPAPDKCGTPDCMVTFAGYKWWTEYQFYGHPNYFYNMKNAWSPRNVTVDAEGLHLFVRPDDLGGGTRYAAAEAVTAFNADGTPAQLGYGTYLVTATIKTAPSWDQMDPNVAFGAFTYERDPAGDGNNPARELDLAEISRWGRRDAQPCRNIPQLCTGNAQFTLQRWEGHPENVHRYTIAPGVKTITLVMKWTGPNQPVTFQQFDGAYTLDTLPAVASHEWTTSPDQNPFIPASGCQQFHLNFWMGNFPEEKDGYNPPPASPQEVVVSNFQYRPAS